MSTRVVAITEDFVPALTQMGVGPAQINFIPNWAPLELEVLAHENPWALEHQIERPCLIYSGTLGLKHDTGVLRDIARRMTTGTLVVVSEGPLALALALDAQRLGLRLRLLPFQPYERLAEVLATADVLVAALKSDASVFSVPSKVLTYMCAGRPILGILPRDNQAARVIDAAACGLVVAPGDATSLEMALSILLSDQARRHLMGQRARLYAEREFDIKRIGDRFESVILEANTEMGRGRKAVLIQRT